MEKVKIGTTNTNTNELLNEVNTSKNKDNNLKLNFKIKCSMLYYLLASKTENSDDEEAEQVREHEERLCVIQLQFTSVSY